MFLATQSTFQLNSFLFFKEKIWSYLYRESEWRNNALINIPIHIKHNETRMHIRVNSCTGSWCMHTHTQLLYHAQFVEPLANDDVLGVFSQNDR